MAKRIAVGRNIAVGNNEKCWKVVVTMCFPGASKDAADTATITLPLRVPMMHENNEKLINIEICKLLNLPQFVDNVTDCTALNEKIDRKRFKSESQFALKKEKFDALKYFNICVNFDTKKEYLSNLARSRNIWITSNFFNTPSIRYTIKQSSNGRNANMPPQNMVPNENVDLYGNDETKENGGGGGGGGVLGDAGVFGADSIFGAGGLFGAGGFFGTNDQNQTTTTTTTTTTNNNNNNNNGGGSVLGKRKMNDEITPNGAVQTPAHSRHRPNF